MKYFFFFLVYLFINGTLSAQDSTRLSKRPKIGLTLSGGGAKGLAHIGILKAIDSAGLKVDYITGTSMGSIIGALYAVGYSADSIEKLARGINWDMLLSNQANLRSIIMEEKGEYNKYDIELPWVNHWFRLPTGVLEGQELWLKFSELFFPFHNVKDFHKFHIPFKCIATDISSGEAVVMDSGEITTAVRSSMAIPSIFTAVDYHGRKLVDGGIVRNFPVKDVREMGADITIGSNVASGLLASDKVNNAIQVLLQVAFFREAEDMKLEIPLCNVYVPIALEKYSMGSFGDANQILDSGIREGRKLYPVFKKMADSLNNIYGRYPSDSMAFAGTSNDLLISSFEVNGLHNTSRDFFIHSMDLRTNRYYSPAMLSRMVRRAAGTRYYNHITYSLQPLSDSSSKIIFDVKENPLTFAKIGLHYNEFSGISAILNLTTRDFITPNSRSLLTLNIGENFRIRAEHLQYLGRISNFALNLSSQFEQFNITTYSNYKESGLYGQNYLRLDGKIGYSSHRNLVFGGGTRFEWINYNPSISSSLEFQGRNNFFTSYLFLTHNTLDKELFAKRGVKLNLEGDWVFEQNPNISIHGASGSSDTLFSESPYTRFLMKFEGYSSISNRSTLLTYFQSGINFNYHNNIMNEFSIGGLNELYHNEITFCGLREGTFYTTSVAEARIGLRYQLFDNSYLTGRANILLNNFAGTSSFFTNPNFLSGYSLTFSYNFVLGPVEVSAMYCDQSHRVEGYVNIGIPF